MYIALYVYIATYVCSPPLWRVDQELVESATEEIQAQERKIRAKLKERPPSEQGRHTCIIDIQ